MLKMALSLQTSSENREERGRPKKGARQKMCVSLGTSPKKMRCSQYRLDIVLEAFQDEEMRAQKGPQDGSKSALKAAENDDFARDILKKMNKFNHIVLKTAVLISSWNRS